MRSGAFADTVVLPMLAVALFLTACGGYPPDAVHEPELVATEASGAEHNIRDGVAASPTVPEPRLPIPSTMRGITRTFTIAPAPVEGIVSTVQLSVTATDEFRAGASAVEFEYPSYYQIVGGGPAGFGVKSSRSGRTSHAVWATELAIGTAQSFTLEIIPSRATAPKYDEVVGYVRKVVSGTGTLGDGDPAILYVAVGDEAASGDVTTDWPGEFARLDSDNSDSDVDGDEYVVFEDGSVMPLLSGPDPSLDENAPLALSLDVGDHAESTNPVTATLLISDKHSDAVSFKGTARFPIGWSVDSGQRTFTGSLEPGEELEFGYRVTPDNSACDWIITIDADLSPDSISLDYASVWLEYFGGYYPCRGGAGSSGLLYDEPELTRIVWIEPVLLPNPRK